MVLKTRIELEDKQLDKWIREANISKYRLGKIAGVSPSWINSLGNNELASIKRERIIGLGVALNLSMEETNGFLIKYNKSELTKDDIPIFIEVAKNREITPKHQPFYVGHQQLSLFLISVERLKGKVVTVNYDSLSHILKSVNHVQYGNDKRKGDGLAEKLDIAALQERKQLQESNLNSGHDVEFYISQANLKKYARRAEEGELKKHCKDNNNGVNYVVEHFANLLHQVKQNSSCRFYITKSTHPWTFELKYSFTEKKLNNNIVFFLSPKADPLDARLESNNFLAGYVTSEDSIFSQYESEYRKLQKNAIEKYKSRIELKKYILELFKDIDIDKKNRELLDSSG